MSFSLSLGERPHNQGKLRNYFHTNCYSIVNTVSKKRGREKTCGSLALNMSKTVLEMENCRVCKQLILFVEQIQSSST